MRAVCPLRGPAILAASQLCKVDSSSPAALGNEISDRGCANLPEVAPSGVASYPALLTPQSESV